MSEYKQDQVREHSFDGIQEFDNRLPNWWLWILYGSIVFAVGYWVVFETLGAVPGPNGRYALEMEAAMEAQLARMAGGGPRNESLNLMASMPEKVAEGRALFETYCVVCHADQAQGNVGPNLTDSYWIHGGQPIEIYHTVTEGVPEKGMAAWGRQLGPTRVQKVVSYVISLRNTNVAGKDPQGELYQMTVDEENAADELNSEDAGESATK